MKFADYYLPNNLNWVIASNSSTQTYMPTYYEAGNLHYSEAWFTWKLQRLPDFFVTHLLVPGIILTTLQLSSFFIPPATADRATYAVTIMLSFLVLQSQTISYLPPTHQTVVVAYYVMGEIVFATICAIYASMLCWMIYQFPDKFDMKIETTKGLTLVQVVDGYALVFAILLLVFWNLAAVSIVGLL